MLRGLLALFFVVVFLCPGPGSQAYAAALETAPVEQVLTALDGKGSQPADDRRTDDLPPLQADTPADLHDLADTPSRTPRHLSVTGRQPPGWHDALTKPFLDGPLRPPDAAALA
ncbi:hypothetical protein GRF61_21555 [Azoarcus sp. TTM-91]|uniref:hypothetical protein n=1 Tax=Azoarcus sp. TTM-91 TaxID=2691581 RepID=UPI00145CF9BD|nr:hypothetical protein [Azoarcus sp. TTM-91]NMG37046.1 hypothetical protein [Azoarcus sp. TTM-91]